MSALKGGNVKRSPVHGDGESDDESGTDELDEDDTSDTNTDTEDES